MLLMIQSGFVVMHMSLMSAMMEKHHRSCRQYRNDHQTWEQKECECEGMSCGISNIIVTTHGKYISAFQTWQIAGSTVFGWAYKDAARATTHFKLQT